MSDRYGDLRDVLRAIHLADGASEEMAVAYADTVIRHLEAIRKRRDEEDEARQEPEAEQRHDASAPANEEDPAA